MRGELVLEWFRIQAMETGATTSKRPTLHFDFPGSLPIAPSVFSTGAS
jgi:hypothetical protein